MNAYIQAQGFEIWQSIVDGYTAPKVPPTNDKAMKLSQKERTWQYKKWLEQC
jgi:hypothetical protein